MKKVVIMLFLIITSVSFSIGRHKAIILNGRKEYDISIKADLKRSDFNFSENKWDIASSTILRNGSIVDYIKIEKDGDIIKGIIPLKLVVTSANSQRLLNGPLLQVIKVENIDLRIGNFGKRLEPQYFTFIKNIDEVIIKQISEIDLGTLYSGEELSRNRLSSNRIILIKYGTNKIYGGYYPMMDIDISGSGTNNRLKVEGGTGRNLTREITLLNQRDNSTDKFKINGTYFINFESPEKGYIDLDIYGISGEYPKDYGLYKGVETINITLY